MSLERRQQEDKGYSMVFASKFCITWLGGNLCGIGNPRERPLCSFLKPKLTSLAMSYVTLMFPMSLV